MLIQKEIASAAEELEELLERVEAGDDVEITQNGVPVARLILGTRMSPDDC